ncbi:ABC transporter permease subunit [Arthrobacter sp. APC 3897]|uniref:ABC transporter permease n=1 Tax=Arthrobacter sp. APC 3897 TaxID=3035204 RepID=UPI0025B4E18D|nr:ABC transporter permease subunit [Arthrobacter sp. APC 3897]MDN3482373.1 ABC transporter permease subunit [Arthrobacter sp. APC 3897]
MTLSTSPSAAPPQTPASYSGTGAKSRRISSRPAPGRPGGTHARLRTVRWQVTAVLAVLLVWQLAAVTSDGSLPGPLQVASALAGLWGTGAYWTAVLTTLKVWALGLAICTVIGIPLGLLIGISLNATRSTRWVIDFFRTIPTIALLPLVLLLFGPSIRMEVTLIVLSAVWPLMIQSMYAVKQVEPVLKWVTKVFRVSRRDRIRFLWAPSVTLLVTTGMRLAATIALLMTVSAEYIGGAAGLGKQLSISEQAFQRPEVIAYALTAGIIGLGVNMLIIFVQRRLLWWHPIIRGERA